MNIIPTIDTFGLAYKGGQIDLSSGRDGALALVEYAEEFIAVKEQINAKAA